MVKRRYCFVLGLLLFSRSVLSNTGDVAPLGSPDGQIDSGDAIVALRMAQRLIHADLNADVSAPGLLPDGVVDTNDALTIQQAALGFVAIPSLTLPQANEAGLQAIANQRFAGALHLFNTAVAAIEESSDVADSDAAYFFRALTRIVAFGTDISSNNSVNNGLGDLLNKFGCLVTPRSDWENIDCPTLLPSDSPDGIGIQLFLSGRVKELLVASLSDLDHVSEGFNQSWTGEGAAFDIESDYGDVLFFNGVFRVLLSQIAFLDSLNLDSDIDEAVNTYISIEQLLNDHPDLLSPSDATKLTESANYLDQAMEKLIAAIDYMQSETDLQYDDFVNLSDALPERIADMSSSLMSVRDSLTGVPADATHNEIPFTVTLSNFFGGLNLRQKLPPYTGDTPGLFPDTGFGNVINGTLNVNDDINGDGVPDILQ